MSTFVAILGLTLVQTGAVSAQSATPGRDGAAQAGIYDACLAQARVAPEEAYTAALDWHAAGGGLPARHCAAVALLGLGAHDEAATRLETLATEVPDSRPDLRLGLLAQAAQAWLISGRAQRAEALQTLAVDARPDDPQLRADRAVSRLTLGRYWAAIDDLDIALTLTPEDPELLLYRASAYRYLEVPDLARDDVDRALALDAGHAAAWLERGILDRMTGDTQAARRAWIKVLELSPDGAVADAARARLEALDLN